MNNILSDYTIYIQKEFTHNYKMNKLFITHGWYPVRTKIGEPFLSVSFPLFLGKHFKCKNTPLCYLLFVWFIPYIIQSSIFYLFFTTSFLPAIFRPSVGLTSSLSFLFVRRFWILGIDWVKQNWFSFLLVINF